MPEKDAYKVLQRLKDDSETVGIPVIMLTAVENENSRRKTSELCDEDYIITPVDPAELQKRVEKVLETLENLGW